MGISVKTINCKYTLHFADDIIMAEDDQEVGWAVPEIGLTINVDKIKYIVAGGLIENFKLKTCKPSKTMYKTIEVYTLEYSNQSNNQDKDLQNDSIMYCYLQICLSVRENSTDKTKTYWRIPSGIWLVE